MLKYRQFVNELLGEYPQLNEAENNKSLQRILVSTSNGSLGIHSNNNRVKNLKNLTIDEFANHIKKILKLNDVIINQPGRSGSSKYSSVQFDFDGVTRNFILAGGAIASRGHGFEENFYNDLIALQSNRGDFDPSMYNYPNIVKEFIREFKITDEISFTVTKEGGANKKREVTINPGGGLVIGNGNLEIGSTITDITLDINGVKKYISLKLGNSVQFSNTGLVNIFPKNELASGKIENKVGNTLLDVFGIDNETFCDVFNSYGKKKFKEVHEYEKSVEPRILTNFVQSCMGYGYYMLHISDNEKTFEFYEVTESIMKRASQIKSKMDILYGGVTGGAKNVYVSFKTDEFLFEIDFRNRSGAVEPTVMGTKYKYLNWKGIAVS
jgi:hypothetical protein